MVCMENPQVTVKRNIFRITNLTNCDYDTRLVHSKNQ